MTEMPPLLVLAGGLASRMKTLTEKTPKSMLLVAGEPFISHQLRLFARQGFRQVILCVGFLWEQIAAYVEDGSVYGLSVHYSVDGKILLGPGGAVKKAAANLDGDLAYVYGDSYLDIDYPDIYRAFRISGRQGLMTVYRNENKFDSSNVLVIDNEIVIYDKKNSTPQMRHIDYGLGFLKADVLQKYPSYTNFDLAEIYGDLVQRKQLAAFEVHQRFYEIGSISGLAETERFLSQK